MNKLDIILRDLTNYLFRDDPDAQRLTIDITLTGEGYSRSSGITRDRPEPAPVSAPVEPEPEPDPFPGFVPDSHGGYVRISEPAPEFDPFANLTDLDAPPPPPDVLSNETPLPDSTPHPRKPVERKRGVRLFRSQVKQIKVLLRTTKLNHKEIAKRYGVTPAHISHIKRGTRWRNV